MDSRLIRRPVLDLLSGRSQCLLSLNAASRRNESSYRRSKQRLNIKPDSSFLLGHNSPNQDHIVFNPPSSAPSVLHTPLKFLPKEDKRRQLLASTAARHQALDPALPPAVPVKRSVPHHHLSEADVKEIQRLKREEPDDWTCAKLARKFNCSTFFVSICLSQCGGDDSQRKKDMAEKLEAIRARWGPRRRKAREEKSKRYELANRGE
ncbi:related to ribosomal protein YmL20 precursor, mitochondrial [Phialocephala subalpina]|uniref:Related to ribosomal protein YmL20, mitochondrial n=1 Tax=Phialocephala subalpina TaxID=576137 RepID=A0A1L7X670_9HELO|nr:related to ribosomal protein YmL20 precursor, mitochondrial [Phialocephala subalpina]